MLAKRQTAFYRQPAGESPENRELMRIIDEAFMGSPWYGSRHLRRQGWCVGRKRVWRLMRKVVLSPIYQAPKTSEPHPQHRIYPSLLRHLAIERPNHVWFADVTYIPMQRGFLYTRRYSYIVNQNFGARRPLLAACLHAKYVALSLPALSRHPFSVALQ